MKRKIHRLILSAVLSAVALALFSVELLIPPFPFAPSAKIGLANIVTLFMISHKKLFTLYDCFCVLIVRCLLACLITGRITAVAFSLAGGICALLIMLLVRRLAGEDSVILMSISGSVFHNLGQILIALFFYGTFSAVYYLPSLFLIGVLCGIITGLCVIIMNKSGFYRNIYKL